jgi:hypothetical protein
MPMFQELSFWEKDVATTSLVNGIDPVHHKARSADAS